MEKKWRELSKGEKRIEMYQILVGVLQAFAMGTLVAAAIAFLADNKTMGIVWVVISIVSWTAFAIFFFDLFKKLIQWLWSSVFGWY